MSRTGSFNTADFDPGIIRRVRCVVGGVTGPDLELGITSRSSADDGAVVGAAPAGFVPGVAIAPLRYATYPPNRTSEKQTAATRSAIGRGFGTGVESDCCVISIPLDERAPSFVPPGAAGRERAAQLTAARPATRNSGVSRNILLPNLAGFVYVI
jgi:hypothetical protein